MAADIKKAHFTVLSAAILYSLLHKVQAKDNCKVILEDVKNCWIKYPEVPSSGCNTGTNTSLVKCSIKNLKILQSCDFHKSWEGAHVTELYTKAMDIICEDESLQKEFEKDEECWKEAHLCATHIITLPKKKNNELCKNASALLNDCKSKDQNPSRNKNCSEHIGTFVNTLFESSQVCGVAMLLGQVSFVLIAYLVASFLSL